MKQHGILIVGLLCAALSVQAAEDAKKPEWKTLFNGKNLDGWKVVDFGGAGEVTVRDQHLVIGMGDLLTGVSYTNAVPTTNYELEYEARKTKGADFFASLTVPVKESHCTLVLGGWGGGIVGISSINDLDASENQCTIFRNFEMNRWYKVRFRYADEHLTVWLDDEQVIHEDIDGSRISLRAGDIDMCVPLGLASWQTEGEIRKMRLRSLPTKEDPFGSSTP